MAVSTIIYQRSSPKKTQIQHISSSRYSCLKPDMHNSNQWYHQNLAFVIGVIRLSSKTEFTCLPETCHKTFLFQKRQQANLQQVETFLKSYCGTFKVGIIYLTISAHHCVYATFTDPQSTLLLMLNKSEHQYYVICGVY